MARARARRSTYIEAPPEDVYDFALGDLSSLHDWMTSVDEVESADPSWPAVGSSYVYSRVANKRTIRGRTTVLEVDRPRRVLLREELMIEDQPVAAGRPVGDRAGRSIWTFESEGDGTKLTMEAEGIEMSRIVYLMWWLLFSRQVSRNVQATLGSLKRICEEELEDASAGGEAEG